MKRQHLIQLLQYLLVWVGIGLFVVFVMEESFVDFVLKYRVLFLIASISYFYYYSIEYEVDKKFRFIRSALIYGNAYLFAHVFFRPLLGISHELFILLGLIILGLWGTTKMTSRWRWILQVLGGTLSLCILISGIFYLYPEEPDIVGFLSIRDYEISVHGISEPVQKKNAYIRIVGDKKSEDFYIEPGFYKELVENCKISYLSLKKNREEEVLITAPNGDIYKLYPQSEVQIEFLDKGMVNITVVDGKIGFLPGLFTSSVEVIGDKYIFSGNESGGLSILQDGYNEDLVGYLRNQISSDSIGLANSEIMYNINGTIIRFLAFVFPTSYSKNLHNYNEFQKYLNLVRDNNIELGKHSKGIKSELSSISLWELIKKNINVGKENWYMF